MFFIHLAYLANVRIELFENIRIYVKIEFLFESKQSEINREEIQRIKSGR